MRQLYLAATGMNRGKTTVALGLFAAIVARGHRTGFIKPVGQRYAVVDGTPADEDAILMKATFELPDQLDEMSPVHIPRGFTRAYIEGRVTADLPGRIREAHAQVAAGREVLVVEGTGHAGVGAVVGLSNATVARMLGARALVVSEGGVGRPIDEIVLNAALFEKEGVEVVGAVVNKVDLDAQPDLPAIIERGLAHHGVRLLGVLPYRPLLSNPTLAMLAEQLEGEVLVRGPTLEVVIEHVLIGAMQPHHLLERVRRGTLVIAPGDREDAIMASVTTRLVGPPRGSAPGSAAAPPSPSNDSIVGLVLTGGYRPGPRVLEAIRHADLFALLVRADTYQAASAVHDLLVKTHPADTEKIELIKALVAEHLDVDRLLDLFATA